MAVFKFEQKGATMLTPVQFAGRLAGNVSLALIVIGFALAAGMLGYHLTENMDWLDAFLNAAMLLGGMGPVGDIPTVGGKVFAGVYALYAGLVLIAVSATMLTPIIHRVLHRLHLEDGKQK